MHFKFSNDHKVNQTITFGEILNHIYTKMNGVGASFASKLAATINPNLPVWGKEVLRNIGSELNKITLKVQTELKFVLRNMKQ